MPELLQELLSRPIFAVTLSVGFFLASNVFYQRSKHFPLLHPLITAPPIIAAILKYADIDYATYFAANDLLIFLLGPITVAMAIPLYQQLNRIRSMVAISLWTIIIGASLATGLAYIAVISLGGNQETMISLLPKTVTTAIAYALSEEFGGNTSITAGATMLAGLTGVVAAPTIFKLLKINDHRIMGFTMGIMSHGSGTTRAYEISPVAGAFASLGMGLTGAFISIVLPIVAVWFFI